MARYYLLCNGTASLEVRQHARSTDSWQHCFPKAAAGFLFHDTDAPLEPAALRRPLHTLLEIYEQGKEVFVVRVSDKTLFASFSLAGVPHPLATRTYDAKHKDMLRANADKYSEGYLFRDVRDPHTPIVSFEWNGLYDNCERLERFTDSCPCPDAGYVCTETILPALWDVPLEALRTDYGSPDANTLNRKRYANIAGFEYLSGALTTPHDFMEAMRPWDYHDFELVNKRKEEYKNRGVQRKQLDQFRKSQCGVCCFADKGESCGLERQCNQSTDETAAWAVLHASYAQEGLGQQPSDRMGFTPEQVSYLISKAGDEFRFDGFSDNRSIRSQFAGFFRKDNTWGYAIVTVGRPYTRRNWFINYAKLYEATRGLLPERMTPRIDIPYNQRLAASILGSKGTHFKYHDHRVKLDGRGVTLTTASDRQIVASSHLTDTSSVREYYRMAFGKYQYVRARELHQAYDLTTA